MMINSTERARVLGNYIASTGATVRSAAQMFEVSKSTVHSDITKRLRSIDRDLYEQVRLVLEKNKAERHLRGGLATQKRWSDAQAEEKQDDFTPGTDCKN